MSEPTMCDRVAAALQRGVCKHCRKSAVGEGGGITDCDCERPEWDRPTPIEQARAAIEAMREPTTEWGPRLRGYKVGGFWSPMWGFRPESGMCGAPKAEIEKWKNAQQD